MKPTRMILAALLALFVTGTAVAQSFGAPRSGLRAERWEAYGSLRPIFSENVDFEGGSSIDVDDDLGFAFGMGYNFNEHLLIGGEFSWSSPDYEGTIQSADTPGDTATISGEFDAGSISTAATWHFMEGPFTPYANVTLGYTWIDTNIADGPPVTGCWWDPWFGYICDTFVDTKSEEAWSYGLGAGVRWDGRSGWFARIGYEERWLDLDEASGTPSFGGLHLDLGGRF